MFVTSPAKKEKAAKNRSSAKKSGQSIPDPWQAIDAILNNLGEACRGDTSLFYKRVILPLAVRARKWRSVDTQRAFLAPHKKRSNYSRKSDTNKRAKVVWRSFKKKKGDHKGKPIILRGYYKKV